MSMPTVLESLPVSKVHPDPANPRSDLANLDELAASIQSMGLLEPIVVRPHAEKPGEWMIVAGHRRHAAHVKAGLETIPALIRDGVDDRAALAAMLVENLQREDLDPLDEAGAYRRLVQLGWKQKDIADAVARSAAHISKRIRLLDLPDQVAKAVRGGDVTVETGYVIAKTLSTVKGDTRDDFIRAITSELTAQRGQWDAPLDSELRYTAEDVTRRHDYAEKRDTLVRQLTVAGQTEMLSPDWKTCRKVEGYNALDVDWDAHQKEPCSAFVVVNRGGEPAPEYYCTDPSRHQPDGESKLKLPADTAEKESRRAEAEAAQDERAKAREAAKQHRRAFYLDAVARAQLTGKEGGLPVNQFGQFHQTTRMLIHTLNGQDLDVVAELLDLDGWKTSAPFPARRARIVAEFNDNPVRVNMAVLMAATEAVMAYFHAGADPHDYRLEFLDQLGYGGEQAALEGVTS